MAASDRCVRSRTLLRTDEDLDVEDSPEAPELHSRNAIRLQTFEDVMHEMRALNIADGPRPAPRGRVEHAPPPLRLARSVPLAMDPRPAPPVAPSNSPPRVARGVDPGPEPAIAPRPPPLLLAKREPLARPGPHAHACTCASTPTDVEWSIAPEIDPERERLVGVVWNGAAQQTAAPPFRVCTDEAAYLLRSVDAHAAALRAATASPSAGEPIPELQARLAVALTDARLCATDLFRTFAGRRRLRGYFGALRLSGPPGAHLVRAVAHCLAQALASPLPVEELGEGPEGGPSRPREADVEAALASADALLEATTTWATRMDSALFDLSEGAAEQLAARLGEAAAPFAGARSPTRARALYLRASVLRLWEHREAAVDAYYEVWSELRRKQLVPSALEARLITQLADLLFETFRHREALHAVQAAYVLGADAEGAALAAYEFELAHTRERRLKGDLGAAERHVQRAIEVAERLGPAYSQLRANAFLTFAGLGAHRRSAEALRERMQGWTASLAAVEAGAGGCGPDPALPDLDLPATLRYSLGFQPADLVVQAAKAFVATLELEDATQRVAVTAHIFYHMGEYQLLTGDVDGARRSFERCAAGYAGRPLDCAFPPEHPRRRRTEAVLAALRAGERPPSRFAPFAAVRRPAVGERGDSDAETPPPAPAGDVDLGSVPPTPPLFELDGRGASPPSPVFEREGASPPGPGPGPPLSPEAYT